MEIDLIKDESVENTKILLNAIKKKVKNFNKINGVKISFSQAKIVFINGAKQTKTLKPLISGFLSLNRFLDALNLDVYTIYSRTSTITEMEILNAKQDLKDFNIIFDISDIDELYLSDKSINLLDEYV